MALAHKITTTTPEERNVDISGFDYKFLIDPGFSIKIEKDMPVYVEDSPFRNADGQKIKIFFLCKDSGRGDNKCVTFGALQRGIIPKTAENMVFKGEEKKTTQALPPLINRKMSIQEFLDENHGRILLLKGITECSSRTRSGGVINLKIYHWQRY